MTVSAVVGVIAIVCAAGSESCQQRSPKTRGANIRQVNFREFSYRIPDRDPDRDPTFHPLNTNEGTWITVKNGEYEVDNPAGHDWVRANVRRVSYGDVTGDGKEEALVALQIATDGTQHWGLLLVYGADNMGVRLIGGFWTGDRANEGLHRAYAERRHLIVEVFDPATAAGDCCASGAIRIRLHWKGTKFVEISRDRIPLYVERNGKAADFKFRGYFRGISGAGHFRDGIGVNPMPETRKLGTGYHSLANHCQS